MKEKVIVFAERILPSTQVFIPTEVENLRGFSPIYAGLTPASHNLQLKEKQVLLRSDRKVLSKISREMYRWTGIAPAYHRTLKAQGAKLIHAHFAEGGPAALFLSKRLRLPMLLHLRGGAELMSERNLWSHWFEWPYLAYRAQIWKRASMFLCASEYVRSEALKGGFPYDKLQVHYTGIDREVFQPRLPVREKDPNLVLFIGRLIPYKGCEFLIRAMQLVQRVRPQARLVLIGDGSSRAGLQHLSDSLNARCEFLGELKQPDVRTWLDRARVFCAPSVTMPDGESEAFGMVFIEAQAMGVPAVGSRHGGIPETMIEGKTGFLAEERDVEGLARHIIRFLADDDLWISARAEGMRWVNEHFDNATQVSKLEHTYVEAIKRFRGDRFEQSMKGVCNA